MKRAPFLSLVLALIALAGCKQGGGGNANEVVVGEFASLTGATATFGQGSHKGTQMAIDEINAAGGLLGKKGAYLARKILVEVFYGLDLLGINQNLRRH